MITLGTFKKGELPADLVYQFLDADGAPLSLFGLATTYMKQIDPYGVETQVNSTTITDSAEGEVTHYWDSTFTDQAGTWILSIWVSDGSTYTLASDFIQYNVA